jgi:hypothetical protein
MVEKVLTAVFMKLTVGTCLQNGKYIVQSILDQSDFGVTYQATHTYLEQTVIIQTLGEVIADPHRASKLQQHFLAGVNNFAKAPHGYRGRVLDYFVESQMPFVVLEYVPGQAPPKIQSWLLPANDKVNESVVDSNVEPHSGKSQAASPSVAAAETTLPPSVAPTSVGQPTPTPTPPEATPILASTTNQAGSDADLQAGLTKVPAKTTLNGLQHQDLPLPTSSSMKPHSHRLRPALLLSLVATAAIAGVAGASFGWAIRFDTGKQRNNSNSIFSKEEPFSSQEGWPVQESPSQTPLPINAPDPVPAQVTDRPIVPVEEPYVPPVQTVPINKKSSSNAAPVVKSPPPLSPTAPSPAGDPALPAPSPDLPLPAPGSNPAPATGSNPSIPDPASEPPVPPVGGPSLVQPTPPTMQ